MTPEDKQLIEDAAKALGKTVESFTEESAFIYNVYPDPDEVHGLTIFNPLTSTSDRCLLMDMREIDLEWMEHNTVRAWGYCYECNQSYTAMEDHDGTLQSKKRAANRAVTRVAAEVQRQKEKNQ